MRPRSKTERSSPASIAVCELRRSLGETQQKFADTLDMAITTIARYETDRTPKGKVLLLLERKAKEARRPDLAGVFRREYGRQIGKFLGPRFLEAARRFRATLSPEDIAAIRSALAEVEQCCSLLENRQVNTEQRVQAAASIRRHVIEINALLPATIAGAEDDEPEAG